MHDLMANPSKKKCGSMKPATVLHWHGRSSEELAYCQLLTNPLCTSRLRLMSRQASKEVGLLHDAEELLLIHLPITITISFIYHFLQLLICHAFTELLGNPLQIFERDLPGFIIIEQAEGFEDLILWITIEDLVCHHLQELLILDGSTAIVIDIGNHLLNLLLLGLKAKGTHSNFQLFRVDGPTSISVEQVEGFLDLLLLLLCKFLLLLATSVESAESHDCLRSLLEMLCSARV
mmetsp:Transcript_56690/g.103705  ORF Transcript_56690/g.103705 Transcript_56690/m.103705 type:complete len:234 (+) Transcript_56690:60-761(+)